MDHEAGVLEIVSVTPDFAIGPHPAAEDFESIRAAGYASVLNARPDDESGTYLLSQNAKRCAHALGLRYAHCPTENHGLFEIEAIDLFEQSLFKLPKPIFAHCKSGTRAAILWALALSRHRTVEDVIATLRMAGVELDFLEQELRQSAEVIRPSPFHLKEDLLLDPSRSGLIYPGETGSDT